MRTQTDIGVDLVNDGEQSKSGFQYYARARLSGHQPRDYAPGEGPPYLNTAGRDWRDFPGFFAKSGGVYTRRRSFATAPVRYIGQVAVRADIDNLKQALEGSPAAEGVLMAVAPGTIEHWIHNEYYGSQEEFLFAVADAMHEEYRGYGLRHRLAGGARRGSLGETKRAGRRRPPGKPAVVGALRARNWERHRRLRIN